MDCNNDFCDIEEKKPALCCGTAPVKKINLLSAWIRCPKCGSTMTACRGKFGVFVMCDEHSRHTFGPDQI
jgi:hypothetical protein